MEEERFEELSISTCNEEEKPEEQKDGGSLLSEATSPIETTNFHLQRRKAIIKSTDLQIELRKTQKKEKTQAIVRKVSLCPDELPQDDVSAPPKWPEFRRPTHLVTPLELLIEVLRANSAHEANHQNERKSEGGVNIQDDVISNDTRNEVVDVNVIGETRQIRASENKENIFCSQASDLGMGMAQELHALSPELPQDDVLAPPRSPVEFEHPTHLLTPLPDID